MADCYYAYGDQKYAPSPYGSGYYEGLQPRDIRLYYPNADGSLSFDAPITYYPPEGMSISPPYKIPDLTPIGEDFFSDIFVDPYKLYVTYQKVWIFNHSETYSFNNVEIAIDPETDPLGWVQIANTDSAASIPADGKEINVSAGWGPGEFDVVAINLGDLPPQNGNSFWVKRSVTVEDRDQKYAQHSFIITGVTEVEGVHCTP